MQRKTRPAKIAAKPARVTKVLTATQERFRAAATLNDLLSVLDIKPGEWDFLLVGDGSGNTWELPFGSASTLISAATFDRKVFASSGSHGTNNVAEMMAYLMPLLYLSAQGRAARVHIVTDSEYVANTLNGQQAAKSNIELWQAIRATRYRGLTLHGHWIPRGVVPLNEFADRLANAARISQQPLVTGVLGEKSIYDVNPAYI